ncbi:MAG: GCN5-related N-acetyltransferase [Frankiales bacterium]|nr:GCN5-related N-acetyltransferase [Frankiales bacterium]
MAVLSSESGVRIECVESLTPALVVLVDALAHAAAHTDGVPPLSDHALQHVRHGGAGVSHVLVWAAGDLVAYAHLDTSDAVAGPSAELAVHPRRRGAGHGRALLGKLQELTPDGGLRLWAHGELPVARRLAEGMGFTRTRVLAQMGRTLDGAAPVAAPPGATLRPFVPNADEDALLAVNNAAFEGHPEQGRWTAGDLRGREREPWFDPSGLLMLESDGELAGFVWTKVHGHGDSSHAHTAVGEIYVLAVAPHATRRGFGRFLAVAGMHHLAERGLPEVILYVDESNVAAVSLYERLGFARRGVDVLFAVRPR